MDQSSKAKQFAGLHINGDPIIIYNAWDAGSAKAIATGDHPVGFAHGFDNGDFDGFTFETYLGTIKEMAIRIGDLPFSVDISNGEGLDGEGLRERVRTLLDVGVVGINFEDRLGDSSGVRPIEEQVELIRAIRTEASEYGVPLFINARTDLFSTADGGHAELLDEAVERADAYQAAGASGFFTTGLMDTELIAQLADRISLPLNIIRLPGAPTTAELKQAGVSRISYGPVVQMEMIEWLKEKAKDAVAE